MDILATKDRVEREEEEAERLVRPLPKLKPPRHDRRRERMEVDRDPDTEGDPDIKRDPDLSLNRREVGGSDRSFRSLVRNVMAGKPAKMVTVRRKEDDKVVQVSKDTLHGPDAAKYEDIKDTSKEKPKGKPKLRLVTPPKGKKDPDPDSEMATRVVDKWLGKNRHKTKDFREFGNSIPTSVLEEGTGEVLYLDPKSKKRVHFERLPLVEKQKLIQQFSESKKHDAEEVKARKEYVGIRDSIRSLGESVSGPAEKALLGLADPKSESAKKLKQITSKGFSAEDLDIAKTFPELGSVKLPKNVKNVADLVQLAKSYRKHADQEYKEEEDRKTKEKEKARLEEEARVKAEEEKARKDEEEAKKWEAPPPPPRWTPTEDERYKAQVLVLKTFPREVAGELLDAHPEDIEAIVKQYQSMMDSSGKPSVEAATKALASIGGNFIVDPMQVEPPKEIDGVSFADLDPDTKTEAMHKHRLKQVATNIAIRAQAISSLTDSGLDPALATRITDHTIAGASSDPEEHREATLNLARDLFVGGGKEPLEEDDDEDEDEDEDKGKGKDKDEDEEGDERFGYVPKTETKATSSESRKKTLQGLATAGNSDAQILAVASFQGEDYREALERFGTRVGDSPKKIVSRLREAKQFFKDQAKNYPDDIVGALEDPYQVFQTRVRFSLSMLSEKEAKKVRHLLAEEEADAYDYSARGYERNKTRYLADLKKWEMARDKHEEEAKSGKESKPFSIRPPVEPKPPVKPSDYELVKTAFVPSVSVRSFRSGASFSGCYSSYSFRDRQMGTTMASKNPTRTSVYHGVQPYPKGHEGFAPYSEWGQAHIRDLGASDFETILSSAKSWLKSPFLSKSIDGVVPDSKFRVALDLAIRDVDSGKYSSAIDANLYNMLLAKLAGESLDMTLLTIREASSNRTEGDVMTMKIAKEEANKVLARLDRIAGTIQDNAETWGIPFEAAKSIVNDLDRTADEIEKSAFGENSLASRQVEVLKTAKVIQQDADEGYMATYNSPMAPVQVESDEPYMSLFKDDQTVGVHDGKSSTGRPLAP